MGGLFRWRGGLMRSMYVSRYTLCLEGRQEEVVTEFKATRRKGWKGVGENAKRTTVVIHAECD